MKDKVKKIMLYPLILLLLAIPPVAFIILVVAGRAPKLAEDTIGRDASWLLSVVAVSLTVYMGVLLGIFVMVTVSRKMRARRETRPKA